MQVLEKLFESVVVEGKRVHRIDIELVVEIDPTVFQVIVAAALRGWLSVYNLYGGSSVHRSMEILLFLAIEAIYFDPTRGLKGGSTHLFSNLHAIMRKLSIVIDSNILYYIAF